MGQPRPLFVYFCSFKTQILRKTVDFSGIRTRIDGVVGEHADHLTTTTAPIVSWVQTLGREKRLNFNYNGETFC